MATPSKLELSTPAPRVLVISFKNPPYNLIDSDLLTELYAVLASLKPETTGSVILTGSLPGIFLSHHDVQEIVAFGNALPSWLPPPPPWLVTNLLRFESTVSSIGMRKFFRANPVTAGLSTLNLYREVTTLIRSMPQVVIAAINGRALGGGTELALACDFRIMVDTPPEGPRGDGFGGSGMGQPEILIGIIPGGGGSQMLTRMLGHAKALELCLEGNPIDVQEAYKLGLITKVVPAKSLMDEAIIMATRLSRRSPFAIAAAKNAIHIGGSSSLGSGLLREQAQFAGTAVLPETVAASQKYVDNVEVYLGPKGKLAYMQPLLDGTFADFTPGSAAKAVSGEKDKET